jgi:hypothetical protein
MRCLQSLLILAALGVCEAGLFGGCDKEKYFQCRFQFDQVGTTSSYVCTAFGIYTECIYDYTQGCDETTRATIEQEWLQFQTNLPADCRQSTTFKFDSSGSSSGEENSDSGRSSNSLLPSPSGSGDSGSDSSSSEFLSGSSGSFMAAWQWVLLLICCCICLGGAGGAIAYRKKKRRFQQPGYYAEEMPYDLQPMQPMPMTYAMPMQSYQSYPMTYPVQTATYPMAASSFAMPVTASRGSSFATMPIATSYAPTGW